MVETIALVQRRLGMATLATLRAEILGVLEVSGVDDDFGDAGFYIVPPPPRGPHTEDA